MPATAVVETYENVILEWLKDQGEDEQFMENEQAIQTFLVYFERTWIGKPVVSYNQSKIYYKIDLIVLPYT